MELTELDPDVQDAARQDGVEVGGLFNEDDLMDIADELEPNNSAAVLVWENVWARKVTRRCATQAASSSPSSGFRTRSCRQPESRRSTEAKA